TTLPPDPPPPPPSLFGTTPVPPFALIVPAPVTLPVRIMTIPPPLPPLLAFVIAPELFRVPAPPPAPTVTRAAVAGKAVPPKPPIARFVFQELPPIPPAPPFAPPPPPVFWSLADGCGSVPPPPAVAGAPRAVLPLG